MNRLSRTDLSLSLRQRLFALAGVLFATTLMHAAASAQQVMPAYDAQRLFKTADAIAVFELTEDEVPNLVAGPNGIVRWTLATSVVREIQGGPLPSTLEIDVSTLLRPFAGGATLELGDSFIGFLRSTPAGTYELTSAHYGLMRVSWLRAATVSGQTAEQVTVAEVLRALDDPDADVKIAGLKILGALEESSALSHAARLSTDSNDHVVAAALLLRFVLDDASALDPAIRLIHESATLERGERDLLAWAFTTVPGLSIAKLNQVLEGSGDPTLRTAAAYVLATRGDRSSIHALISALDQSEPETQYRAVIGLSRLAHINGPGRSEFMRNPVETIEYWKARWKRAERSREE